MTPLGSNSAAFDAAFVGPGLALVRYELGRMLATQPGLVVTVATPEGPVSTGPAGAIPISRRGRSRSGS